MDLIQNFILKILLFFKKKLITIRFIVSDFSLKINLFFCCDPFFEIQNGLIKIIRLMVFDHPLRFRVTIKKRTESTLFLILFELYIQRYEHIFNDAN